MRPQIMLTQLQGADIDRERHRGERRRHARHRALPEARVERPSLPARTGAALLRVARRDRHSLTTYPCRLPDGRTGRTAIIRVDGEWVAACRVA
jgi:hypothetical protein